MSGNRWPSGQEFDNIFYDVGRRFDLGGGRNGPDMMVGDIEALTSAVLSHGRPDQMEEGFQRACDWAKQRFNLPNVMGNPQNSPQQNMAAQGRIWSLFQKK